MGRDKSLLPLEGVPQALRTVELLEPLVGRVALVVQEPDPGYGRVPIVLESEVLGIDREKIHRVPGTIWGVAAALVASSAEWTLAVACDLPFLTEEWFRYLISRTDGSASDMILPAKVLCMMCHRRCTEPLLEELDGRRPKLGHAMGRLDLEMVTEAEWRPFDTDGRLFFNMNRPEDYAMARNLIEGRDAESRGADE